MSRRIEEVARLFMVEPADLKDTFESFLLESQTALERSREAVSLGRLPELGKLAHGLKGTTANLRLTEMNHAVCRLEAAAKEADAIAAVSALAAAEQAFLLLRQEITGYYNF